MTDEHDQVDVVFFFDCDNTLLDNDAMQDDLRDRLVHDFGAVRAAEYWVHFEALRSQLGYADYLGALQQFRRPGVSDSALFQMSSFLLDYPFASRLYPGAPDVLRHLQSWGPTVILSDGDVVFQPHKLRRSGLWDAVKGRVLIYVHKEEMLDDVVRRYPARHYVMVDDKLRILATMKRAWQDRLTTVFPRQGHYARDPQQVSGYPAADVTIERIGALVDFGLPALLRPA
jgi:FMN phosphatase YigB (HAD superfamily)